MGKSKKIDVKNVLLSVDNNNIFTIQGLEDEEIPFENLTDELKEMINLGKPLNIKVSKAINRKASEKKPIYKYVCGCGNVIKSKNDDLHIKCLNCNFEFEKEE